MTPLHIKSTGPQSGAHVVFLHGLGTSSWMWSNLLDQLPEYRCHLIDLPGHGGSADVRWVSLEETANAVRASLPSDGPIHLAAFSIGGYVALNVLAQDPTRFGSATISGVHMSPMPMARAMRLAGKVMAPLMKLRYVVRKNAIALGVPNDRIDDYVREALKMRMSAFTGASNDVTEFVLPNLEDVTAYVTLLAGEKEHELIRGDLTKITAAIPTARAALVADAGHGWITTREALFARVLTATIENSDLPAELV